MDDGYSPEHRSESEEPDFTEQEQLTAAQRLHQRQQQRNAVPDGVQLWLSSEDKTAEARSAFVELEQCTYQYKHIGSSGQTEHMTCVCHEEIVDGVNVACTDEDCINRSTKIECINGSHDASCGDACGNQRFQRRSYAQIAVFQTEKKGYGVRAECDLEPDAFVWEYLGEVIDERMFKKRMVEYDVKKFKHFYFMMLQKGEFIDATLKGSLGRFLNHSCNPNCYVEKWVVGEKLKMGIFAKRRIVRGEELTFNYNVDRYGANAQPCHCGEPNCIGVIGGKTQTDSSLLPQMISTALGASVDEEQAFLKLLKDRGEAPENINAAYLEQLEMLPMDRHELGPVMGALLQAEDPLIASKLLERIEMSSDAVMHKVAFNHGFASFGRLLQFYFDKSFRNSFDVDDSLVVRMLKIMQHWVVSKQTLDKFGIVHTIDELVSRTDSVEIKTLCEKLKEKWAQAKEYLRIQKKDPKSNQSNNFKYDSRRVQRQRSEEKSSVENGDGDVGEPKTLIYKEDDLPMDWFAAMQDGKVYYFNEKTNETQWTKPSLAKELEEKRERDREFLKKRQEEEKRELERRLQAKKLKEQTELQRIISEANKIAEEERAKQREEEEKELRRKQRKEEYKRRQNGGSSHHHTPSPARSASTPGSQHYGKEEFTKRWKRYFAQEVPNLIKKYRDELGPETVKTCAKEIVELLVDKEYKKDPMRKPSAELSLERRKKLKSFTEPYMEKVVEKVKAKKRKSEEGRTGDQAKKQHA